MKKAGINYSKYFKEQNIEAEVQANILLTICRKDLIHTQMQVCI